MNLNELVSRAVLADFDQQPPSAAWAVSPPGALSGGRLQVSVDVAAGEMDADWSCELTAIGVGWAAGVAMELRFARQIEL